MTTNWKLVPAEQTSRMRIATVGYHDDIWKVFLTAAPPPPETVLTEEERDAAMKRAMVRWDDSRGQGLQVVTADEVERAVLHKLGGGV